MEWGEGFLWIGIMAPCGYGERTVVGCIVVLFGVLGRIAQMRRTSRSIDELPAFIHLGTVKVG